MQVAIKPEQVADFIGSRITFEIFDGSSNRRQEGIIKGITHGWIRLVTQDSITDVSPEAIKNIKLEK
jgi:hypothetical protein